MKKLILLACLLTLIVSSYAQTILWDAQSDKKLTFLKDEKRMNVEYDFSGVIINGKTEAEFLNSQKQEDEDIKDSDKFTKEWESVKVKRYPLQFEKTFKSIARKNMKIAQGDNENFKLVVKLVNVKTGEGTYLKNVPALADFDISIVETATNKVMAHGKMLNVKGIVKAKTNLGNTGKIMRVVSRGMNMNVSNRIAKCYEGAAIATAKYIIRFNKKKK